MGYNSFSSIKCTGGPSHQISIMNERLKFAYLVLFECLIENSRHFEQFSRGHLFEVWDLVDKFRKIFEQMTARKLFKMAAVLDQTLNTNNTRQVSKLQSQFYSWYLFDVRAPCAND